MRKVIGVNFQELLQTSRVNSGAAIIVDKPEAEVLFS